MDFESSQVVDIVDFDSNVDGFIDLDYRSGWFHPHYRRTLSASRRARQCCDEDSNEK